MFNRELHGTLKTELIEFSRGLDFSTPWHKSVQKHKVTIRNRLHLLHPAMQQVLDMCHITLGSIMLIDLSNLR